MKYSIFSNWHLMRYVRLGFALFLFFQAYKTQELFFVAFGLFFAFQAVFNLGCGSNGCGVTYKNKKSEQ